MLTGRWRGGALISAVVVSSAICVAAPATAQAPVPALTATVIDDVVLDADVDGAGNRYVLVSTDTQASPSQKLVRKYDAAGTLLWEQSLGQSGVLPTFEKHRVDLAVNAAGDIALAGTMMMEGVTLQGVGGSPITVTAPPLDWEHPPLETRGFAGATASRCGRRASMWRPSAPWTASPSMPVARSWWPGRSPRETCSSADFAC